MDKFLKFVCGVTSLAMVFFYGIYISDIVFGYLPYSEVLSSIIDNIVFYAPMIVCALASIVAVWQVGKSLKWIMLAVWIIIIAFSFVPGDILSWFA